MMLVLTCASIAGAHEGQHEGGAKFTKHFNETLFAISGKGQVSIEVLLDEKEYKIGSDVIGIVVHDSRDEDVEGAKLTIMVSGMAEPLKVKEKGSGLYLAPKAGLPKDGTWKLSISVNRKKIDDGAEFDFPEVLKSKLPKGKYLPD